MFDSSIIRLKENKLSGQGDWKVSSRCWVTVCQRNGMGTPLSDGILDRVMPLVDPRILHPDLPSGLRHLSC